MTTLRSYFTGIASKYLSAVDATGISSCIDYPDPAKVIGANQISNQYKIGSNQFTKILGNPCSEKLRLHATFLFFHPDAEDPESCTDKVTYYDTRANQPNRSCARRGERVAIWPV
jgi:hypothetical protein